MLKRYDLKLLRDRNKNSCPIIADTISAILQSNIDLLLPHSTALILYALSYKCTLQGKQDAALKALTAILEAPKPDVIV